jgi:hypothetical protein
MDVERELESIEIDADVDNNFDDLKIRSGNREFFFQIKDINGISLSALNLTHDAIFINGKKHKLSDSTNVIFFKQVDIQPDSEIFGMPAYKLSGVYIVSLNRESIDGLIGDLYKLNRQRESLVDRFFNKCLDNRKLKIERIDFPSIDVFDTKLIERTIDIGRKHLTVENILTIEGKPGVGKSHLVNRLTKEYPRNIVYRFWISSQDKEYNLRLKFTNFIFDFSKKLFNDQVSRTENDVLEKLWSEQRTVIIDGLDHVENYNRSDLKKYIAFIQKLQTKCKTIVLTRPLLHELKWSKHELGNWNDKQTRKVLDELFHITDYNICSKIYSITDGYPILVKYLAEHYKQHNNIPDLNSLASVDEYYNSIFDSNVKTKSALTIFLCCRSYYMKSEIKTFLGEELAVVVNEFINDYPYLFERRLNRVSLLHDSFNTYLRKQNIDYSNILKKVNKIVFKSISDLEHKFLSRSGLFDLERKMKKAIVIKYSSISVFRKLVKGVIDFEAIQAFYSQLREWITELSAEDLTIENYYDLSLIINITNRDHISTHNQFLFTYVKSLLANGYSEIDITSSGHVFAMMLYIQTGNADLLQNLTSDGFYDTSYFIEDLQDVTRKEEHFFNKHRSPLTKTKIESLLVRDTEQGFRERVTFILEDLFLHENHQSDFKDLTNCIKKYIHSEDEDAINFLEDFLLENDVRSFYAHWILSDAKKNLLALGHVSHANDYLSLSMTDFILKYRELGSFKLLVEILNFIRLSLHNNRAIDISSISLFWTKFYQRKDYTVMGVPFALHVFENSNFLSKGEAIRLITSIQESSEKGHRGLLADYLELHSPDIISYIVKTFDIEPLHVQWFTLPSKFINRFPDRMFNISMKRILEYHHSGQIDLNEVINVIQSNRCDELKFILDLTKCRVRIEKGSKQIGTLRKKKIPYLEYANDTKSPRQNGRQRLNDGILTARDKKLILKQNMKPEDVAGFSDGWHSTLADVNLFKVFARNRVRKSIKSILFNALVGKVNSINSFHYLYYFPGNIPKLVSDFEIDTDLRVLFESFKGFMELSGFDVYQETAQSNGSSSPIERHFPKEK